MLEVVPHAHDQYQVMYGKRRVAYVVAKIGAPINFLNKAQSGVELTDGQKEGICVEVREKLAAIVEEREASAQRLSKLIAGGEDDAE